MPLILVLILLPFIYILSLAGVPVLQVFGRTIFFLESTRNHLGPVVEGIFIVLGVMLIAACFTNKKVFWFGLLPVLLITSIIGRW
jgi:hypothetical protein